jgi:pimeloyl-ACP methyl ester carboxylesterase
MDIRDITEMYERVFIPRNGAGFTRIFANDNRVDASQLFVYVHGWRMDSDAYRSFSQSMMKRLYWSGFQGRFATVRWMTYSSDDFVLPLKEFFTFNNSEFIAYKTGDALASYFHTLRVENPSWKIAVAAHSMGNVAMMEALKITRAAGRTGDSADINNYVLMQAAVPAHCYDPSYDTYDAYLEQEIIKPTPDLYRSYGALIRAALRGQLVNFFNPRDYALMTGYEMIPLPPANPPRLYRLATNFREHQLEKPDKNYYYQSGVVSYNATVASPVGASVVNRTVTDIHEKLAHVARPRSLPAGGSGGVGGEIERDLNLFENFGINSHRDEHSAEFNWNVQALKGFYDALIENAYQ